MTLAFKALGSIALSTLLLMIPGITAVAHAASGLDRKFSIHDSEDKAQAKIRAAYSEVSPDQTELIRYHLPGIIQSAAVIAMRNRAPEEIEKLDGMTYRAIIIDHYSAKKNAIEVALSRLERIRSLPIEITDVEIFTQNGSVAGCRAVFKATNTLDEPVSVGIAHPGVTRRWRQKRSSMHFNYGDGSHGGLHIEPGRVSEQKLLCRVDLYGSESLEEIAQDEDTIDEIVLDYHYDGPAYLNDSMNTSEQSERSLRGGLQEANRIIHLAKASRK